jgi:hypothetical protein
MRLRTRPAARARTLAARTITREELSEYIEDVLADAGIDVEALLQRRGVNEAAGEWRDW